jgi:hypothetical protein
MRNRELDARTFEDARQYLDMARLQLTDVMACAADKPSWKISRALKVSSMIEMMQKMASKCEMLAMDCRDGSLYR